MEKYKTRLNCTPVYAKHVLTMKYILMKIKMCTHTWKKHIFFKSDKHLDTNKKYIQKQNVYY